MKAKIALVVVCILAVMLLAGCQWWDDLMTTGAGTSGAGSPQMIIDAGEVKAIATQYAGARQWSAQQTELAK